MLTLSSLRQGLYELKQFTGSLDDTLVAGITATGLAGFANTMKSAEIMLLAREYAIALKLINKALGSPEDALKNSTLLAVLILAIFETTAGSKQFMPSTSFAGMTFNHGSGNSYT